MGFTLCVTKLTVQSVIGIVLVGKSSRCKPLRCSGACRRPENPHRLTVCMHGLRGMGLTFDGLLLPQCISSSFLQSLQHTTARHNSQTSHIHSHLQDEVHQHTVCSRLNAFKLKNLEGEEGYGSNAPMRTYNDDSVLRAQQLLELWYNSTNTSPTNLN